jgi:hypothetical protein
MTTTFLETDHPRAASGAFKEKIHGTPEVGLAHPALPAFDPTFYTERTAGSNLIDVSTLPLRQAAAVRNATQAVSDAWALEHGLNGFPQSDDHATAQVFRDGEHLVVDVEHTDLSDAPFGAIVVVDKAGATVAAFDNVADDFGPRYEPMTGLRAQLLADLAESSSDGSLGDTL